MGDDRGAVPPSGSRVTLPFDMPAAQLADLAASRPDLWDEIWHHPNCYDGLRQWMAERYEEQQAPAARQAQPAGQPPGQPAAQTPKRKKGAVILAAVAAAALALAGTGTALALTGTWPFGAGGVLGGAPAQAEGEKAPSFADGAEERWSVDGESLGLGRAHLGYMERMMPPVTLVDPGWADTIQIDGAVLVHASADGSRMMLALLDPGSGDPIWSEETGSEYSGYSCEASFDLSRVFCVLRGEAENEVVQLDASGEIGRFGVAAGLNRLSIDGEGLVLSSDDRDSVLRYSEQGEQLGEGWSGGDRVVDGYYLASSLEGWELYDAEHRLVGQQRFDGANGVEPLCAAVLVGKRVLSYGPECAGSGSAEGFAVEHLGGTGGNAVYVPGERPIWLIPADGLQAYDVLSGEQLWSAEASLPGWYQPAQIVPAANGEGGPSNGSVLVSQQGGFAMIDMRSGEAVSIASQADDRAVAVSGDYVLGFLGDEDRSSYRGVEVFDARTGELIATHGLPEISSVVEVRGGPEGVMLAHPFCTDCSTAEGASSIGGYTFVGPSELLPEAGGGATPAAEVPDFIPACPGETILLAWMELEDGWVVVCGVDVDTPSYVAYKPNGEQAERFSLGASKPEGGLAMSSVAWDAVQKRYVAAMADGSKLTLDYTIGTATLRDGETNSEVKEQQRFIRYVFVPLGGQLRGVDDSSGETGAFDVRAPKSTAEDQVRYMVEVLEKAYEGRAMVKDALPKLAGCAAGPGGYADTVAAMKAVRDNRAELLQALDAMPVDKIPEGKQLLADLSEAIEQSHRANVEYVAWAEAANASGCAQLSAAGKSAADASDAPKERFAARWNRVIAPKYGVRTFDAWYI